MGVGQVSETMGHAAPHVAEAPRLDIERAQIPRQRMAELIVMDPLQSLLAAIRAPLAVSYQLYTAVLLLLLVLLHILKNLYCVFNSFFDQCQLQRKALVVEIMESSDSIRSIRHILYDVTVRLIVRSLTTQLQVVQGTMVGSGVTLTSAKLQNCCASLLEHHLP